MEIELEGRRQVRSEIPCAGMAGDKPNPLYTVDRPASRLHLAVTSILVQQAGNAVAKR
jgi:hypothetical protein